MEFKPWGFKVWDRSEVGRAGEPLFINTEKFEQDGTIEEWAQLGMADWFHRSCVAITGWQPFEHDKYNSVIRWELTDSALNEVRRNHGGHFPVGLIVSGYALMETAPVYR